MQQRGLAAQPASCRGAARIYLDDRGRGRHHGHDRSGGRRRGGGSRGGDRRDIGGDGWHGGGSDDGRLRHGWRDVLERGRRGHGRHGHGLLRSLETREGKGGGVTAGRVLGANWTWQRDPMESTKGTVWFARCCYTQG